MRNRLFIITLLVSALQVSCGGPSELPLEEQLETPPAELLEPKTFWPDAPDLGAVVSSEIVATDTPPPPPDFAR